ncbi:MAG: Gfo/Idh/MocA family oxidoreductase [Gemmatimonadetes bacterium]|nr:Gfo/Idh/MocA family oxidoreductase [Gemmatimonadota bacterium]
MNKVIPAMQRGRWTRVVAIASRSADRAREAADRMGVPRSYGSYEELLEDPEVEVVYNPLPNHLHVPWSIKALEAGKHVLCEKPIARNVVEVRELQRARDRSSLLVGEAFMVRTHPQWLEVQRIIASGRIGDLRLVNGHFSYFLDDPADYRSRPEQGGGALLDIGCYPIHLSRFLFGQEPTRVLGMVERDPENRTDSLTAAMLEFPGGHCAFTSGTRMARYQRMEIIGTRARIVLEIPFSAPPDWPARLVIDDGSDLTGRGAEVIEIPTVDQYTVQGDRFSRSVRTGAPLPVPLEDALLNMAVIDAVFRSAETGRWEPPRAAD